MNMCSHKGCESIARKRGLCPTHYANRRKNGTLPEKWDKPPMGRPRKANPLNNAPSADWISQGNCYALDDPSVMFRAIGLTFCDGCSVVKECGAYRRRLEAQAGVAVPGVWGGELWIGPSGTQRAHKPKVGV